MTVARSRAVLTGLAAACLLAGCGVDSEDTPQPIDDTTREFGTTPSVDTRPGPTPSSGNPSSSTSKPAGGTAPTSVPRSGS